MVREGFTAEKQDKNPVPSAHGFLSQAQTLFEKRQTVSLEDYNALQAQAREQATFEQGLGTHLFMGLQELGLSHLMHKGLVGDRVPARSDERSKIREAVSRIVADPSTSVAMERRKAWSQYVDQILDAYESLSPALRGSQEGRKENEGPSLAAK